MTKSAKYSKKYRAANLEICRRRCRTLYQQNKAKYRTKKSASNRLLYLKKRSSIRKRQSVWAKSNRNLIRVKSAKRRALKKAATVNLAGMLEFISAVKSKPFAVCYYCKKKRPSSSIHFDHIIPLSKGGEHSVRNLCTSCPGCNLSKNNKSLEVWITTGQQLMRL